MDPNYLEIEVDKPELQKKVKQRFRRPTDKIVWNIRFNIPLDPRTVNNKTMNVTTLNNMPLKTRITYDSKKNSIEVSPLEAYSKSETYCLNISTGVKSKGGQRLGDNIQIKFKF